jgi:hypothetical protein
MGGTDDLALCTGEQRTIHYCFSCSEEYRRFTRAAMEGMKGLSEQQQLDALRQLRQNAEKHMKRWVSGRSQ